MAYIDTDYLDAELGSDVVDGLFRVSGIIDTAAQATVLDGITADVKKALRNAGYTPPTEATLTTMLSGTEDQKEDAFAIRRACLGEFLKSGVRKGWRVPPDLLDMLGAAKRIRTGVTSFVTLSFSERDGVGGLDFSESDPDVDDARPQIFQKNMGR